jgi:predicted RNA-binding protein with PUA-like domain
MKRWLVKEEPDHYSYADLERDRTTEWNGVHNALALRHLRAMGVGDEAFFYHTGDERAAVGIVRVTRTARADDSDGRPSWSVEVTAVRPLRRAVPLGELRGEPLLEGFDLLRIGRLSVVPVSDAHWAVILAHEASGPVPVTESRAVPARPAGRSPGRAGARRTARRANASGAASRAPARRTARGTGGSPGRRRRS